MHCITFTPNPLQCVKTQFKTSDRNLKISPRAREFSLSTEAFCLVTGGECWVTARLAIKEETFKVYLVHSDDTEEISVWWQARD